MYNDTHLTTACRQMLSALEALLALDELKLGDINDESASLKHAIAQAQTAFAEGQSALICPSCQQLLHVLEKISGQAVCVNMDGDDGNERMLKDILQMADNALDTFKSALPKRIGT